MRAHPGRGDRCGARPFARLSAAALAAALAGLGEARAAVALPPTSPGWATALVADLAPLAALAHAGDERWARLPSLRSHALRIPADGIADATSAIQRALDSLVDGGTLVLERGVYRQTRCLYISNPNVRLLGSGATLHATNAETMCIALSGDGDAVQGLVLTAVASARGLDTRQARIWIRGNDARVAGNVIRGAASAGIWVQGARRFAVVGNRISGTMADGIHHSEGARDGYVADNDLDHTGDDAIAVVSYRSSARSGRVLVENNRARDIVSARGIAVVGSDAVVVRDNSVERTGRAAGIIVTREPSYDTDGVADVVLAGNDVRGTASLGAADQTGQASIDVNAYGASSPALEVRRVLVVRNAIADGRTGGIRVLGGVCGIDIVGNSIHGVVGDAIAAVDPTCGPPIATCRGNAVDAAAGVPDACRGGP